MLINEVESVVGLSKKSIRYYETVGLLNPKRRIANDYRDYSKEDVILLKKIKFLRELDVSIQDLKKLSTKELSLTECMQDKIKKLEEYAKNYQEVKLMCKEIIRSNVEYDEFSVEEYSKKMNKLNKGGFIMRDIQQDQTKKIQGAVISSAIFLAIFLFFSGLITYFQITEVEKMPMALYIFVMGIFIIPMISVVINLITRIKEIKGGEEDEASKY